jgi:hypothetical protein
MSSGKVRGAQVIIPMTVCSPESRHGCRPLQCTACTEISDVSLIGLEYDRPKQARRCAMPRVISPSCTLVHGGGSERDLRSLGVHKP